MPIRQDIIDSLTRLRGICGEPERVDVLRAYIMEQDAILTQQQDLLHKQDRMLDSQHLLNRNLQAQLDNRPFVRLKRMFK